MHRVRCLRCGSWLEAGSLDNLVSDVVRHRGGPCGEEARFQRADEGADWPR